MEITLSKRALQEAMLGSQDEFADQEGNDSITLEAHIIEGKQSPHLSLITYLGNIPVEWTATHEIVKPTSIVMIA